LYKEILSIIDGPVSLETISLSAPEIIEEARALARMHKNVVVKVPILKEGLKAVKALSAEGIRTNVTVTFSPLQAMLAAKCGATYISPFVGRLDAVGQFGMDVVRQIKTIYTNYGFKTQIIVAAVRHPTHVLEAALAGADICTMSIDVLQQLYDHPLTDVAVDVFLKDWAKVPK
jgi:transaldolase